MIVWSEKEGDRWHQPALQVATSGESSNFKWIKPHQQPQQSPKITKAPTTMNEETLPVNPCESATLKSKELQSS